VCGPGPLFILLRAALLFKCNKPTLILISIVCAAFLNDWIQMQVPSLAAVA
jgi:hypothetical protein